MNDTTLHTPAEIREHTLGIDHAVFSPGRTHRYLLARRWAARGPIACWIMLNPSTADAFTEDATSRRCIAFTRLFVPDSRGLNIVNLYALRATDPAELWRHRDPIGPAGDDILHAEAGAAAASGWPVIAAWGTHGARNERGVRVATELASAGVKLLCLGITKDGHPKHPLYVMGDTPLVPYRANGADDD